MPKRAYMLEAYVAVSTLLIAFILVPWHSAYAERITGNTSPCAPPACAEGMAGSQDYDEDAGWWDGFGPDGVNGEVWASVVYNGDLIVAGKFTAAGGKEASRIARWDGSSWHPLGAGLSNNVYTLEVFEGKLYAGGWFNLAGGISATCIACWDGFSWSPVGAGLDGAVWDIEIFDGELVAAGGFETSGSRIVNYIARWDGASWQPLGTGMSGSDYPVVYALTTYGSDLIAGGLFPVAGGVPVGYVARWNGSSWDSLGSGMDRVVTALGVFDGQLVAGGLFSEAGGVPASFIAGWDGEEWGQLGSGLYGMVPGSTVSSMAVYDGFLIVGGLFPFFLSANIAAWDGTYWYGLGVGLNSTVQALAIYEDRIVAGGDFNETGEAYIQHVATWDDGIWKPLGTGVNEKVFALTEYDGCLAVGGQFNGAGCEAVSGVALWDGADWTALGDAVAGAWYQPTVRALGVLEGDLVVGGDFFREDEPVLDNIARWDGDTWQPLGSGFDDFRHGTVHALTLFGDSLVAGGEFTETGGTAVNNIACWDGEIWAPMGPGFNNKVKALEVFRGELIAGGEFTESGGVPVNRIARWNGEQWQPLGTGLDGNVYSMAVYDGLLWVGGRFDEAGGQPSPRLASWDGSRWLTNGSGFTGEVSALTVYEGSLVAGGVFYYASDYEQLSNIARWNGSHWNTIGSGMSGGWGPWVYALCSYGGGLMVGGGFTTAGGKASVGLARWEDPFQPVRLFEAAGTYERIRLTWENPPAEGYAGTLIRYKILRFPADPEDGYPVPNGNDGRFEAAPGSAGRFVHNGLTQQAYFYSAFAYDENSNYAVASRVRARPKAWAASEEHMSETNAKHPTDDAVSIELGGSGPFRSGGIICLHLPARMETRLVVYDIRGRVVRELLDEVKTAGTYDIAWDGRNEAGESAGSGVYFIVLRTPQTFVTQRLVLID